MSARSLASDWSMSMSPSYPYQFYEMAHAALAPARAISDAARFMFSNPLNPLSTTPFGKNISASAELFERMTRRYGKPAFASTTFTSTASSIRSSRRLSGRGRSAIFSISPGLTLTTARVSQSS